MTRMVILHIGGNRYNPLPNNHHTVNIWQELSKGADEYHIFARNKNFSFNTSSQGIIKLHLIPSITGRMYEFFLTSWLVLWWVHRLRPTHLIVQCPVMGGLAATLASRLWKIPILVEIHGDHYFQIVRPNFPGWFEHKFYKLFSALVFRVATRIRSLSNDMTCHLKSVYGSVIAEKAVVIPTRVNTDIFKKTKNTYAIIGRLKLITVGSLYPRKNHEALIYALIRSNLDYQLTIVGEGPERSALEAIIEYEKLNDRIHLIGNIDHLSLARELATHDVYIHYAKSEGLPRAILEAMACGCPVVATNVGFINGVLENRHNAFVISSPWDAGLQSVLNELSASESLRQSIGLAGLETIATAFDAKKVFENYREMVRSL